ncbi:UNVERIFIED_CONTAM: Retrovirus-related Pol polyprotein from transposon TNT 1-94 [Sesamum latifolium]|uniref:Retrovirus-related Pol polyprotein from transposon TNT 1-94 n=1 Tax=Sesamum latifolium TaxID=2727402 RepID=A0AAW2UI91_9LAMI
MKSYNNKVKLRNFQVGDLVLKNVEVSKHGGKLDPSWEGPYKVVEVKKRGTYRLQDMEVPSDGVPVLRASTRKSRPPERYRFVGLTSQLDNDPKTYGEVMSDIDSDMWLEAMESEINSMGSNQVWILVDLPKGFRPVGCKWVYKRRLGADGEVTPFKTR